ncbi:hypothetical protein [Streptomyces rhizosphaerihabitans]|uniref:hypothetical protein n=1 Tax=Streptomyces rhizosphaerihabitans TaxID=1266770 RepID=UPI0021BFE8B2|nr:hypothetical protein [Streptomyces rhizosphaerihabitans]MCT9010010.1 hypothetical protein [Streptomyces rhizosphaerihabitans]
MHTHLLFHVIFGIRQRQDQDRQGLHDVGQWTRMNSTELSSPAVRPCREQAIRAAAEALIDAVRERAARTPLEAAVAAWYPGHPLVTVDAIEAEIVRRRAQAASGEALA